MKNGMCFLFLIVFAFNLPAQEDKFQSAMTENLRMLDTAESIITYQKLSNTFARIAGAEPAQWLPLYYAAYCHMSLAAYYMQQQQWEKTNAHVDAAQQAIDLAKALAPQESEVYALQAFIYQGRIWENPMVKGTEFSPKSHQATDQAIQLDPQNPRPYYLKGQNVLFTPAFYGGGAANALPLLKKAEALFAAEAPSGLKPAWGKDRNAYLLKMAESESDTK